ncbi:hypothetical protein Ac2012v2_006061 [Leucoagaricus gongylophorus]
MSSLSLSSPPLFSPWPCPSLFPSLPSSLPSSSSSPSSSSLVARPPAISHPVLRPSPSSATSSRSRQSTPRKHLLNGLLNTVRRYVGVRGLQRNNTTAGDVVRLTMFGQNMVVLNSLDAARDLLDKRSVIYSDRPRFVLFSDLMGWKNATTHLSYGQRFRRHRRWINHVFNVRSVIHLRPLQLAETLVLLNGLITDPDNFVNHFKRYAAATILNITYGRDVKSVDDHFVKLADRAATLTVESGSPAATLVDFFPLMRHIPTWVPVISNFKRKALQARDAVENMFHQPYERVKQDIKSGKARPSYVSTLIQELSSPEGHLSPEDECDIQGTAGTLYAAAEDTVRRLPPPPLFSPLFKISV